MWRRFLPCLALVATAAAAPDDLPDGLYAVFATPHGGITARLEFERAPLACGSFVGLAEGTIAPRDGRPFYTGLRWYRVVPDFVIQSGDPTVPPAGAPRPESSGDAGHPYTFPDEIVPGLRHDSAGVLSMANAGPDTNSTEFFVTLRDTNRLNYLHSVFGRVVRGLDLLGRIQPDEPFTVRILRVGPAARAFAADADTLRARAAAAPRYTGPPEPGPDAFFDDPDRLLPQEVPRARNFNFKLANFQRFTGGRIVVRLYRRFAPATPGARPDDQVAELARRCGVAQDGVAVAYFADLDRWVIRPGDRWLARFAGGGSRGADFAAQEAQFVGAARARAEATAVQARARDTEVRPSDQLKFMVDEMLDALIFRYETSAHP